jgi:AcrR family transcriptional regulator
VLGAALALAAEQGPGGLTMEAIAKRAGVSKETLYRWWRSKTEVILDAMADRGQRSIPVPDSGDLRRDLRTFLRATIDSADPTTVQMLHALASAAAADESVAVQVRDRFLSTRRRDLGSILERAADRGEITHRFIPLATDLVYGSMWYRLIFQVGHLDSEWADEVAAAVAANRPDQAAPGR